MSDGHGNCWKWTTVREHDGGKTISELTSYNGVFAENWVDFTKTHEYVNTPTSYAVYRKDDVEDDLSAGDYPGTRSYEAEYSTPGPVRSRFVIPHYFDPPPEPHEQKWHGTMHIIEYTTEFEPLYNKDGPDIPPEDHTAIWTGQGLVINFVGWDNLSDDEKLERENSWKTPWADLPEIEGNTVGLGLSVRLERSQCYEGAPWQIH